MSNTPGKFVFEFSTLDEPEQFTTFEFAFLDKTDALRAWVVEQPDDYFDILDELESEYGVHDFVTTGDEEIIGFCSYEVEPSKWLEVMQKWHDFFASEGYTLGPVVQSET